MTNLAICKKCRALTPDTDDDIAEHRRKHLEAASDIERARKAASEATTELKRLQAIVRDYETALDQRAIDLEPEPITMRVVEDDEDPIEPDEAVDKNDLDDDPRSTYADDDLTGYTETTPALAEAPVSAVSGLYTPAVIQ